jgi:hypothetical protein
VGLVVGAAALVAGAALLDSARGGSARPQLVPRDGFTGELKTAPPWPRNVGELRARLHAIGLPALSREGTVLHIHQHLDVFVDGKRVVVPAGIGIDAAGAFISPLHTHDPTGVVHVESPTEREFTLGQFMAVWGVRFTPRCLGAACTKGPRRVRVYANGALVHGDPRRLALAEHEEIAVTFGTPGQLPRPLPRSFDFPPGL